MYEDNPNLVVLVGLLSTIHNELYRQTDIDRSTAGPIVESHEETRRAISREHAQTVGDVRLLLSAAQMAQDIDPEFADDALGSAYELLQRAVATIADIHAHHGEDADRM